jgi:ATP-dependent Clp protease ATP-binding subunit ClpC
MTPNEERILGKFTKSYDSYNDDAGQDDSLKEGILIIQPINPIRNQNTCIEQFGRDLTEMAEEGKLDPVVGREKELNDVCQF